MPTALHTSRTVLRPICRATVPTGEVYLADGVNIPVRDDGYRATVENAGMPAVTNGSFAGSSSGSGSINGKYYFGVRYLDDEGIPGNLSALLSFTAASDVTIAYTNVPTSGDTRTAKREIYRSTAGQADVLYLDTSLNNNTTTGTTGSATDATLRTRARLPILTPDRKINARRFGRPPSHMGVTIQHGDRSYWSVPITVDAGHAEVTNASATVTLRGPTPTTAWINRQFRANTHRSAYTITNVSGVTLTLVRNWGGSTDLMARYAVQPDKNERNKIYPSFRGEPESINPADAVIMESDQTTEEEMTGMLRFGSYVFLATAATTYRWVFTTDPTNGPIYPHLNRGLLNQRCHCRADDWLYVMDRQGVYRFNGGLEEIDDSIRDYFTTKIVWQGATWFHCAAYPLEGVVRFFVCLDGSKYPRHALAFDYRTGGWWEEEYPWMVPSATQAPSPSKRILITGGVRNAVNVLDGAVDGDNEYLTGRYQVTTATVLSATVSGADWTDASLRGTPIEIVEGRGKKQTRIVHIAAKATGKITVDRPWSVKPDSTSVLMIGGIHYRWRSKVFSADRKLGNQSAVVYLKPAERTAVADLRLYENRKGSATTMNDNLSSPQGAKVEKDSENVQFPIHRARTDGEWDGVIEASFSDQTSNKGPTRRYMQIELDGTANREPFEVYEIRAGGVK